MRAFSRTVCRYLALASLASCAASDGSRPDTRFKLDVCMSSTSATQIAVVYALERGLFARHGLDVTLTPIDSGSRAVAALASGSVQICQMAGSAVVNAVAAGMDLVMAGGFINTNVYSLMVAEQIHSAADLKGKAVAVSTPGSASAIAMRMALKRLGLVPDRDVTILSVGGQAERMAALDAGYVAGTLADPPETIVAREHAFHALLDMSPMNLPYQHTGTATTRSFISSNRAVVLNYMKALSEAVFMIKKDKKDALVVLGKLLQVDPQKEAATLGETYDVLLTTRIPDIPYPSLAGIQVLLDEIASENPNAAQVKAEQVADLSIVRELEDSGYFRELAGRKQ